MNSSLRAEYDTIVIYTLEDAQIPLSCIASESSAEDELTGLSQEIKEAIRKHCFTQHKKQIEK